MKEWTATLAGGPGPSQSFWISQSCMQEKKLPIFSGFESYPTPKVYFRETRPLEAVLSGISESGSVCVEGGTFCGSGQEASLQGLFVGPMGRFWSVSRQLPIHQARPFDSDTTLLWGRLVILASLCRLPSMPTHRLFPGPSRPTWPAPCSHKPNHRPSWTSGISPAGEMW